MSAPLLHFPTPGLGGVLAALFAGLLVEFWWLWLGMTVALVWREKRRKIP